MSSRTGRFSYTRPEMALRRERAEVRRAAVRGNPRQHCPLCGEPVNDETYLGHVRAAHPEVKPTERVKKNWSPPWASKKGDANGKA